MGSYMGESTYMSTVRKVDPIRLSNQDGKCIAQVEKLIQLEPKD